MINNKMYIYFTVNLKSLMITQCSKKEYLNIDFNTFFENELRPIVCNTFDEFNSLVLTNYLKKH